MAEDLGFRIRQIGFKCKLDVDKGVLLFPSFVNLSK